MFPQVSGTGILTYGILNALRKTDHRVVLYYAFMLTASHNYAREDISIEEELKYMVTISDGHFSTIVKQLAGLNILHPTSYQVWRRNRAFQILKTIFEEGYEEKQTSLPLEWFDNLPPIRNVVGYGGFPPIMNGVVCWDKKTTDKMRREVLVDPVLNFFNLFQECGVTINLISQRNMPILLEMYMTETDPVLLVYIINSKHVEQVAEISDLTTAIHRWKEDREVYMDIEADNYPDDISRRRASSIGAIAISTSWSERVARFAIEQHAFSLTGPVNMPPLKIYLDNALKDFPVGSAERNNRLRLAFEGLAFFCSRKNGYHAGGVFVADDLIDSVWRPVLE